MSKGNFHAVFDQSTFEQFQTIIGRGNVTKSFENYMLNSIASHTKDLAHINILLVIKKIEEINLKMSKLKAELEENVRLKEIYEQNKNKEETIKLENEAKKIEESKTCMHCHNVINGKIMALSKGVMCKACYLSLSMEQMREYTKEGE